ncbi:Endonuclease/exonuclease/phosphatase, partial [Ephemerocybe angulata]
MVGGSGNADAAGATVDDPGGFGRRLGLHHPESGSEPLLPTERARTEGQGNAQVGLGDGRPTATTAQPALVVAGVRQANKKKPASRAALRIATLNMNGGGSSSANIRDKWSQINTLMRTGNIGVLALQETHLTKEKAQEYESIYHRLKIESSAHPTHPTSRSGVAVLVNKYTTQWKEMKTREIIAGAALLVTLKWHNENTVNILAVYAPTGSGQDNAAFWKEIKKIWEDDRTLPRVDVMLGDCNMVETGLDRLPAHPDPINTVNAMIELREALNLGDGWRLENPTLKNYTYSTKYTDQANSRSRIDRIYINYDIIERTREWRTAETSVKTDHLLVSAQISPKGTPFVGKGRSTAPDFITKYKESAEALVTVLRRHKASVEALIDAQKRGVRDPTNNIQTKWKEIKTSVLKTAREQAWKRASKVDQHIRDWEERREKTLQLENLDEEANLLLDEIEDEIRKWKVKKILRAKDKAAARHHLEGESNSKYDFSMNKNRKPRDSIAALRYPQDETTRHLPPNYTNSTKKMVEIATTHHSSIQEIEHHDMQPEEREHNRNVVINTIKTRVNEPQYNEIDGEFTRSEIEEALKSVPNGKAAGLDGIPVEIWKFYVSKHKETVGTEDETPDIIAILTAVFNDIATHGVAPDTEFAEGWLCPIYKKKDRTDISNYRPITVLNTDYKTLTRTIMNRL